MFFVNLCLQDIPGSYNLVFPISQHGFTRPKIQTLIEKSENARIAKNAVTLWRVIVQCLVVNSAVECSPPPTPFLLSLVCGASWQVCPWCPSSCASLGWQCCRPGDRPGRDRPGDRTGRDTSKMSTSGIQQGSSGMSAHDGKLYFLLCY